YCCVRIRGLHACPTRRSSDLVHLGICLALLGLGTEQRSRLHWPAGDDEVEQSQSPEPVHAGVPLLVHRRPRRLRGGPVRLSPERSEEHTSELQSRENLVCRLL